MRFFLLLIISQLLLISAHAEIYRYIDDNGHAVYVDNLASVPAQFRQKFIDEQEERDRTTEQSNAQYTEHDNQKTTDWDLRWQELVVDNAVSDTEQFARVTPVTIIRNQVIVPVQIRLKRKKVQLNLLLDTGASITLLHQQSIKRLNIGKTRSRRAKIADGSTVDIKIAKMSELSVGPIRLQNIPVAIIENQSRRSQFDGLLGTDVLRQHPYNIDYNNEQIIWQ